MLQLVVLLTLDPLANVSGARVLCGMVQTINSVIHSAGCEELAMSVAVPAEGAQIPTPRLS